MRKMGYTLHCRCTSLLQVRELVSNRTQFSGEKEMMTILLERREFLGVTHLPRQTCSLAMAVGNCERAS